MAEINPFDPFVSVSRSDDQILIDNYLNRSPFFNLEKMKIYKRSPLWIREQFDDDKTENSKNIDFLYWQLYDQMAMPDHPDIIIPNGTLSKIQVQLLDGSYFWCLSCTGGCFDINLANSKNYFSVYEVIYEYGVDGLGEIKTSINGVPAESVKGPSAWMSSVPHKAIGGINVRCKVSNFALSDPVAKGQIDNFQVYYYTPLECDIAKYSPPKASSAPAEIKTIRGFSSFQTTKYTGTEATLTLRFDGEGEHADFQRNCNQIYVLSDDKGILYRGVMELGDVKWLGSGLYDQNVTFKSPNKLGEGWI